MATVLKYMNTWVLSRFVFIFVCSLPFFAKAQQTCYQNPSLEGPSLPHQVPSPWGGCYGSPDTQPGQWGITQPPSNGTSYISLLHSGQSPTGYNEGFTQNLQSCLQAGQTYTISFDLAHTPIYNTAEPFGCYSSLAIFAGNSSCAKPETLWVSGAFTHTNWQTYTATFTPTQNYCFISFSPYFVTSCGGYINVMIDNISCLRPLVQVTTTDVNCFGACDGTATAVPNGGTPPYTFSWSPGGATTQTISNLCPGTYTVTMRDNTGQTVSASGVVAQPTLMNYTTGQVNVSCFGNNNGSATINVSGGTPPYTYTWTPSVSTGPTASNLTSGSYNVVARDARGCTVSNTFDISEPPPANVIFTNITQPTCFGASNGSVTALPGGGTGPFTYTWAPTGGNAQVANNIPAGTYTVSIRDVNGCTAQNSITLTQPPQVTGNFTIVDTISCAGAQDGIIRFNPTVGNAPFTYNWVSTSNTTNTLSNIGAGTYSIQVTDSRGCSNTIPYTLVAPAPVTATVTGRTLPSCFGAADGTITISLNGGSPGYNVNWSPAGGTGTTAVGLVSGTYTALVTDRNGCTGSTSFQLGQPNSLNVSITSQNNTTCFGGSDGSATLTASGGTLPYAYAWSPSGGNANSASGLSAGVYNVTVTDANNCQTITPVTITEPSAVVPVVTQITNPTCFGFSNGNATVSVSGGTPGYTYLWATNNTTNPTTTNLASGPHIITVRDANNCVGIDTAILVDPPALQVSIAQQTNVSCFGLSDASVQVGASGGSGTPSFIWNTPNGSGNTASGLIAGNYFVTAVDTNNCQTTFPITISQPAPLQAIILDSTAITCFGFNDGRATASANGGSPGFTYTWDNGITSNAGQNLTPGTHWVAVQDMNGCLDTATVLITEPLPLQIQLSVQDDSICSGDAAIFNASVAGGVGGNALYQIVWTNGDSGFVATENPLQHYTISATVTDTNGCSTTANQGVLVGQYPVASFSFNSVCEGTPVTLTSTAQLSGSSIISYEWIPGNGDPSGFGQTYTHLYSSIGPYPVSHIVTSEFGCIDTINRPVLINALPVVNFGTDVLFGCAPLCVSLTDYSTVLNSTIVGWSWVTEDGQTSNAQNPDFCINTPGLQDVTLTATSAAGCSTTVTKVDWLDVFELPVADFFVSENRVPDTEPGVQFSDNSYNAASWSWDFGNGNFANGPVVYELFGDTGFYCVTLTATSPRGCVDTTTKCVEVYPTFAVFIPNTFTPNGDGKNEFFTAHGGNIRIFKMDIFDRWGVKIYSTTDILRGWNGCMGDTEVPVQQGVYVYRIDLIDGNLDEHTFVGQVNLIR